MRTAVHSKNKGIYCNSLSFFKKSTGAH